MTLTQSERRTYYTDGHARLAGELETALHKLSGHLGMIHASDNRGTHDDHLPPGLGNIDWPHFLRRLNLDGIKGVGFLAINREISVVRRWIGVHGVVG